MSYNNDSGALPIRTDVRLSYNKVAHGLGKVKRIVEAVSQLIPKTKPQVYGENYFIGR